MPRLATGLAFLLALAGCDEQRPPSPAVLASASARVAAGRKEVLPGLIKALPDQLGEFRATGAARAEPQGTGPMDFPEAERWYESGSRKLKITIFEAAKLGLADAVTGFHRKLTADPSLGDRPEVKMRPLRIGGRIAVARHRVAQQKNEIEIVVDQRFIVGLELTPASGIEDALPLARGLDLDGLLAL